MDTVGLLDDSIFRQVAELHVTEGFPWANHCDVSAEALHAGDIVSESEKKKKHVLIFSQWFTMFQKVQYFSLKCSGVQI